MFYKSDFSHHLYETNKSDKGIKRWTSNIAKGKTIPTIAGNLIFERKLETFAKPQPPVKPYSKKDNRKKGKSFKKTLGKIFHRFCENTTIHGVRYLGMKNQHWSER